MPELDAPRLRATLRTELNAAWQRLREAHAQDELYGFGVYTTGGLSYLTLTAFSERGLDQAVQRMQADEHGRDCDPALLRQTLRWSPCDSPLHTLGGAPLPESDAIVQAFDFEGFDDDDDGDEDDEDEDEDDGYAPEVGRIFALVVQALQEMDRQGQFGSGAARERLVLCVWKGDQSLRERHEFARALNPPAVARRFGREMNDGSRAFREAFFPGGTPYEEEALDDD